MIKVLYNGNDLGTLVLLFTFWWHFLYNFLEFLGLIAEEGSVNSWANQWSMLCWCVWKQNCFWQFEEQPKSALWWEMFFLQGIIVMIVWAPCINTIYFWISKCLWFLILWSVQAKHQAKNKDQLLSTIRKFREGMPVIDLKDAYPNVMEDLQVASFSLLLPPSLLMSIFSWILLLRIFSLSMTIMVVVSTILGSNLMSFADHWVSVVLI